MLIESFLVIMVHCFLIDYGNASHAIAFGQTGEIRQWNRGALAALSERRSFHFSGYLYCIMHGVLGAFGRRSSLRREYW